MEESNKPIIFGGESYPENNTAVIMIGGAGTNKKKIVDSMMQIDGEVFSSERGLEIALRSERAKKKLIRWGFDIDKLDMNDPKNITEIYNRLDSIGELRRGSPEGFLSQIMLSDRKIKPNLIYMDKVEDGIDFYNLTFSLRNMMEYDIKNIHIVWVVEDYKTVKKRNLNSKGLNYSDTELSATHHRTSSLMKELINGSLDITKYMDGDIWVVLDNEHIIQLKKSGSFIDNSKLTDLMRIIAERIPSEFQLNSNSRGRRTSKKQLNREIREKHFRNQDQRVLDEIWEWIVERYY